MSRSKEVATERKHPGRIVSMCDARVPALWQRAQSGGRDEQLQRAARISRFKLDDRVLSATHLPTSEPPLRYRGTQQECHQKLSSDACRDIQAGALCRQQDHVHAEVCNKQCSLCGSQLYGSSCPYIDINVLRCARDTMTNAVKQRCRLRCRWRQRHIY